MIGLLISIQIEIINERLQTKNRKRRIEVRLETIMNDINKLYNNYERKRCERKS